MRRLLQVFLAALVLTGVVVVLPVWQAPGPEAVPVRTSAHEVEMGSVDEPGPDATVRRGTSAPEDAVPDDTAVLSVTRDDVPEFSLVGVTWRYDLAVAGTVVQVRARTASGAWGEWTRVEIQDAAPDADVVEATGARGGTEPLWTGPSRGVQVELVSATGAAPEDVRLDLIDPGSSPADATPGEPEITDSADAAVTMPAIYGRAQWGADESLRDGPPEYASRLSAATIHHTVDSNGYAREDVPAILRSIYRYHAVSLGWGDVGYNVLVDKYGRLWEGRFGGLGRAVVGAHAGGFNTGTVGVSMIGNYDAVRPPTATVDAIVRFLTWKLSLHGVNPAGTVRMTSGGGTSKYPAGTVVTLPTVFGHRDVRQTACPGQYGYARLPEIRDRVAGGAVAVWRIRAEYDGDPALQAALGAPRTAPTLTPDGKGGYATYQNGALYYNPATGVHHVPNGAVRSKWGALSWERGPLGYPTSDVRQTSDGGWYGHFQGGSIYWSEATGAHTVAGAIRSRWAGLGWQTSALGYPVSDQRSTPDGGAQFVHFSNGSLYWSAATGARVVAGSVKAAWASAGWERGSLGLPVSDVGATPDGRAEFGHFVGGSLYVVDGTPRELPLPVVAAWRRSGWERGALGYPAASLAAAGGGQGDVMGFAGGSVYVDEAGTGTVLHGDVEDAYVAAGGPAGDLGWPTADVRRTSDGRAWYGRFEGGELYVVGGVRRTVPTPFAEAWARSDRERGPLGYPTSAVAAAAGGGGATAMSFEGGAVYRLADGALLTLTGSVEDAYTAKGGSGGVLGLPRTDVRAAPDGRGSFAHFAGGSVYATTATGAHVLTGPVRQRWAAAGWERGLGYPTSSVAPTPDGRGEFARFERGTVYWTSATGARVVSGPVADEWTAAGGADELGYPRTDVRDTPDRAGRYAHFQQGSVYWTAGTGAHAVSGAVKARWAALGWERGLGYPTSRTVPTPDGRGEFAHFQRGSIYSTADTGAHSVRDAFKAAWARRGWERGALGYPTSEAYAVTGGTWQDFEGGTIRRSTATGRTWVVLS